MTSPSEWALARLRNEPVRPGGELTYLRDASATFRSTAGTGLSLAKLDQIVASFSIEAGAIALAWERLQSAVQLAWLAAVEACSIVLCEQYSDVAEQHLGLFMFWDAILPRRNALTRVDDVRERLWRMLLRQLQVENDFVRASALHGIGHLKFPGARQEVGAVIDLRSSSDLAAYARQVLSDHIL